MSCPKILKSGPNKGKPCGRDASYQGRCSYHNGKLCNYRPRNKLSFQPKDSSIPDRFRFGVKVYKNDISPESFKKWLDSLGNDITKKIYLSYLFDYTASNVEITDTPEYIKIFINHPRLSDEYVYRIITNYILTHQLLGKAYKSDGRELIFLEKLKMSPGACKLMLNRLNIFKFGYKPSKVYLEFIDFTETCIFNTKGPINHHSFFHLISLHIKIIYWRLICDKSKQPELEEQSARVYRLINILLRRGQNFMNINDHFKRLIYKAKYTYVYHLYILAINLFFDTWNKFISELNGRFKKSLAIQQLSYRVRHPRYRKIIWCLLSLLTSDNEDEQILSIIDYMI